MSDVVKYQDIVNGLRELGIKKGDTLLVHSSLRSFGTVKGGAPAVIRALLDVVGERGNVVMPTLSFSSIHEQAPFFDVNKTPSDCGIITETFRKMPGVIRSVHPFSSASAFGPDSRSIAGIHQPTPCGVDSPYYRVFERKGYSLFIGSGWKANTLFHVAEEMVNPPYLRYKVFPNVKVKTASGEMVTGTFSRYDCYQRGIIRKLEKMGEVFRSRKAVRDIHVGKAHLMLISAEDNVGISCEILRNNCEFILETADQG